MKKFLSISIFALLSSLFVWGQSSGDVFVPIGKYMETGDTDGLSAWFADNLEIDIQGTVSNCTRSQAKQIMKQFFAKNAPTKFEILHKSGRSPMTYAVGNLNAGGVQYRVIIYVKAADDKNMIQQLRIEKE
ncbi:MAG: DUF4783 domain-containing protein [Bacteroidales bacterium]|nr:DUF4783 domain-containing protein [Bacteroidales bacterium]